MSTKWVLSCEHGGNTIPASYSYLFAGAQEVLNSHRGYDPGALELFELLKENLADFSHYSKVSRLLIELNRSLHHKNLFSPYTKELETKEKDRLISEFYLPYRELLENGIQQLIKDGHKVIHLSVHSFTPVLNGEIRNADIGLLYDPSRLEEKEFCYRWRKSLNNLDPKLRVRFNYPYMGKADGFTTFLRRRFPENYAGIELEVNQKYARVELIRQLVSDSLLPLKEEN